MCMDTCAVKRLSWCVAKCSVAACTCMCSPSLAETREYRMCAEHMQGLEGNAFWAVHVHVLLRAERETNNVHVRVMYKHVLSILSFKYSVYMYVHVLVHCTCNVFVHNAVIACTFTVYTVVCIQYM